MKSRLCEESSGENKLWKVEEIIRGLQQTREFHSLLVFWMARDLSSFYCFYLFFKRSRYQIIEFSRYKERNEWNLKWPSAIFEISTRLLRKLTTRKFLRNFWRKIFHYKAKSYLFSIFQCPFLLCRSYRASVHFLLCCCSTVRMSLKNCKFSGLSSIDFWRV